jgi:predicted nuclease of predicted toxin-antitoxin system
MRLLFDEQFPISIIAHFPDFTCQTVHGLGWSGVKNGELLQLAAGVCDVFVTLDRSLQHQQKVSSLRFGVVLVRCKSNRIADLLPLVPVIVSAAKSVAAGTVVIADA